MFLQTTSSRVDRAHFVSFLSEFWLKSYSRRKEEKLFWVMGGGVAEKYFLPRRRRLEIKSKMREGGWGGGENLFPTAVLI